MEAILKTSDNDSEIGYTVECDIEYPVEIHEQLKEFVPCPETIIPKYEWLTDYQTHLLNKTQQTITYERGGEVTDTEHTDTRTKTKKNNSTLLQTYELRSTV